MLGTWKIKALVIVFMLLGNGISLAASFSADITQCMDLKVTEGKIYVADALYRMDLSQPDGLDISVIVDRTTETTKVLVPKYNVYMEMPIDDPISRMNDPFQGVESYLAHYSLKNEGVEEVAGRSCMKQLVYAKDDFSETLILRRWICEELDFALRIEMLVQEDTYTELSGLQVGSVDEGMFDLPPGYAKSTWEKIDERADADPDITAKREAYEKAKMVKIKQHKWLTEGSEYRALVGDGTRIRVSTELYLEKDHALTLIPYAGGSALKSKSECRYTEPVAFEIRADENVDMLVAKADLDGAATLNLTLIGRQPVLLATYEEYFSSGMKGWTLNDPYESIILRLTADLEEGSELGGAQGTFTQTTGTWDNKQTESHELDLANGESATFEISKDDEVTELDFTINSGRVRVEYLVDRREGSPAAPAFPDKLK